ncbi:reverse transcriptase domain-containing protein [Paludisphaera soli]|uniref:reverse transcriptase domain-containing protein n=1 Tax=Paludisphaera soli TaxID=2712865 RepID=UPI0013EC5F1A|nr:reverse transcriptase domain-containing protein [Paludisphaera soli]
MSPWRPLGRLIPTALRSILPRFEHDSGAMGRLSTILGLSEDELRAFRLGPRYHYRPFTIPKPDGRNRRLLAPSAALKRLQRSLLDEYLGRLPVHPCATAFHPGASTVRHALPHARGTRIATVDLRDFFESTTAARVRRFFVSKGWRGESLGVLMRLCTYRGCLPQGAPTSPCLSNLVNERLDDRLRVLARRSGGRYTRYGDDLAFSWVERPMPAGFQRSIEAALERSGYSIQPRKGWLVREARGRPQVTGVVLAGDGRLHVPWRYRLRTAWLRWRGFWSRDPHVRAQWRGRQAYRRMVERGKAGPRRRPGRSS